MATKQAQKERVRIVATPLRWQPIDLDTVPDGRKGRHHRLVADLIDDLRRLRPRSALKVPVADFGLESVAKVRAALNRATRKAGLQVATRSDDNFFYLWIDE